MNDYELYEIKNNIGNSYYYCSSNFDVIYNNNTYIAKAINRQSIEQDNFKKDNLTLKSTIIAPFDEFINITNKDIYYIKIINKNGNIIFYGTISNIEFDVDEDICTVVCSNITKLLDSKIPKKRFTNSCNNDLFDNDCALIKKNYKNIIEINDYNFIDNRTIHLTSNVLEGYFLNGLIIINNQKNIVMKHTYNSNSNIHELKTFYTIIDSDNNNKYQLEIYPGCDKNYNTCKNKFNNNENFNGFPCVPSENLFMKFII